MTASIVFSEIGAAIQGALLRDSVVSGYIALDARKDVLRRLMRAEEIDLETTRKILLRANAEALYIRKVWAEAIVALDAAEQEQKAFVEKCSKEKTPQTIVEVEDCVGRARRFSFAHRLAAGLVLDLIQAPRTALRFTDFEKNAKIDWDGLRKLAEELSRVSESNDAAMENLNGQLADLRAENFKLEWQAMAEPEKKVRRCLRETRTMLDFWEADFSDPADRRYAGLMVQQYRRAYDSYCASLPFAHVEPRTAAYISAVGRRLETAAEKF